MDVSVPWWLVGPCSHVWSSPEASSVPYVQKKISKNFRGIWTPFGIDIMQNQKQAKKQQLALGTKLIGWSQEMIYNCLKVYIKHPRLII